MNLANNNKVEIIQIIEAVARDKNIDKNLVFEAMEEAIAKAAKVRFGNDNDIRVNIDRKNGKTKFHQVIEVVSQDQYDPLEPGKVTLDQIKNQYPEAKIGEIITKELPPISIGRIAAQSAKQVILQKVREAERDKQYHEFKNKIGQIVSGVFKRREFGNVIVDISGSEALLKHDQIIPREVFQNGERIRVYIYDVRPEKKGSQIFVSRTKPEFMKMLFKQEVPEVYEDIVEIVAIARDPGSRAKVAVSTNNFSIDPVGACVGIRGSRVQAIVNELKGEKIDIIEWSDDIAKFIVSALAPSEITKVIMDEVEKKIEVVVPDEQLKLAIGRRGQNVHLASRISGWKIDIMTEAQESEKRKKEFSYRTKLFCEALNVDEVIAQLLAAEGFDSIEQVAFVDKDELMQIEGFEQETVDELQNRAQEYIEEIEQKQKEICKKLGVSEDIMQIPGMKRKYLIELGKNSIYSLEDFAGLATDEISGWKERNSDGEINHKGILEEFKIKNDEIERMIIKARQVVGWIKADPEEAEAEAEAAAQELEATQEAVETQEAQEEAVEPQEAEATPQEAVEPQEAEATPQEAVEPQEAEATPQEAVETQEAEAQDTQEVEATPQEVEASQEAQNTQEAEAPQEAEELQEAEAPQEAQNTQEAEAPQEAEELQEAEAPQEPQNPEEPQEPQKK